ncbi:MAG: hypothetical protein L6R38_004123 [Xanthoria sp. 2 TBL-2021]|nr:MAG: hypothetical protein L6R38_004123 [Xanthoria sp. 2 TBL-2021]
MSMPDLSKQDSHGEGPIQKPRAQPPIQSAAAALVPNSQRRKHWAKQYRTEIAASSSSLLSTFAAYPLDSVKTRMQAYASIPTAVCSSFFHFADCVRHTYKTEGFKGFWRGCVAPMASVTLVRTISFSIYQKAKYSYSAAIGRVTGEEPLVTVNRPGSIPTPGTVVCFGAAGATAGAIAAFIACPFELTKQAAQISVLMASSNNKSSVDDPVRSSYQQKGAFGTARNVIMHRGVRGLYSGFGFHILRDTVGTAIYFTTYESVKQLLVRFQGSNSPTSPLSVATAGGLCGLVSWACIYPIDSAKTHYQRNCLTTAADQPVKMPRIQFNKASMYRGLGVSMTRSCLINTIFFSSFEFLKKKINALPDPVD